MTEERHNSTAWTGDVKGSAPYKAAQALQHIAAIPVPQWPACIWREAMDKPLTYSAAVGLGAEGIMTAVGGLSADPFIVAAAGISTLTSAVIWRFGDGGNSAERKKWQVLDSAKAQKASLVLTAVALGPLYMVSGVFGHNPELWNNFGHYMHMALHGDVHDKTYWGVVALGIGTTAGAIVGIPKDPPESQTSEVVDVLRSLKRKKFDQAWRDVCNLPSLKKTGLVWLATATPSLVPAFFELKNPLVLPALFGYVASNLLVCISKKADVSKAQPDGLHSLERPATKEQSPSQNNNIK